jgi:hypothetical protein
MQGQTGANGRQGSGGLSLENKRLLHSVVPDGTPGRGSAVRYSAVWLAMLMCFPHLQQRRCWGTVLCSLKE